ncbi:MAG: hypothetical protein JXQ72_07745 [Anaerolineae bacterium]|nr:hypothetical protein [Anaerolineae bacterium]
MKSLRLLSLLLVVILVASPLAVFAQGGDDEMEAFVSEDEKVTFMYPAGWFTSEDPSTPFPAVIVANSETARDKLMSDEDSYPESGEVGLFVMLLPSAFLTLAGVEVTEDMDAGDIAEALAVALLAPDEGEEAPEFGEPDVLELDDDMGSVGYLTLADSEADGVFSAYEIENDVLAIAYIATAAGDLSGDEGSDLAEELTAILLDVVVTISYDGTGDELLMQLMGGGPAEDESGDTSSAPALDGEALVMERCSVCHTTDRIFSAVKTADEWTVTVDRMIGNGATLNEAEREAVIAYLSEM